MHRSLSLKCSSQINDSEKCGGMNVVQFIPVHTLIFLDMDIIFIPKFMAAISKWTWIFILMKIRSRCSLKCSITEINSKRCAALAKYSLCSLWSFEFNFFMHQCHLIFSSSPFGIRLILALRLCASLSSLPKNHPANMIIQHLSNGQIQLGLSDLRCMNAVFAALFFSLAVSFLSLILLFSPIFPCHYGVHCQNPVDLSCFSTNFLFMAHKKYVSNYMNLIMLSHSCQHQFINIVCNFVPFCVRVQSWEKKGIEEKTTLRKKKIKKKKAFPRIWIVYFIKFFFSPLARSRVLWNISCTCKTMLTARWRKHQNEFSHGDWRVRWEQTSRYRFSDFLSACDCLITKIRLFNQLVWVATLLDSGKMLPDRLSSLYEKKKLILD